MGTAAGAEVFMGYPEETPSAGRGIVVCAGGTRMFTNAYVLVRVLRDTLACRLPIEVWHMGPAEMSPAMRGLLTGHGVTVIDAAGPISTSGSRVRDGWQLKAFALARTQFAEVLLLDADQVPVRDPADLFDWPAYRETGAVFWPDVVDLRADNAIWDAVGLPTRQTTSFESGQVLVDRRRHGASLETVLALNEDAERLYGLIYGDKDTFLIGWLMSGAPYTLVPHGPFVDPRAIFQCDLDGAPLFQHRTNAKWTLGEKQVEVPNFRHEADCLTYLSELRRRWSGSIYHGAARSAGARDFEAALAGRTFDLTQAGGETLRIELLAHGEIGIGRAWDMRHWSVIDRAPLPDDAGSGTDPFTLVIEGGLGRAFSFEPVGAGKWIGRRHIRPDGEAELSAISSGTREPASLGLLPAFLAAAGYPACDDPALEAALAVLEGIEPGVAGRLRLMAGSGPESARLVAIAGRIEDRTMVAREPRREADVLQTGYVRRPWEP